MKLSATDPEAVDDTETEAEVPHEEAAQAYSNRVPHGVWQREHEWHEYSFAFTFYRYNASAVLLGSQKVTAALELGASGDEFVSRSAIEVLDVNDNVIGTGCATAVGRDYEGPDSNRDRSHIPTSSRLD